MIQVHKAKRAPSDLLLEVEKKIATQFDMELEAINTINSLLDDNSLESLDQEDDDVIAVSKDRLSMVVEEVTQESESWGPYFLILVCK